MKRMWLGIVAAVMLGCLPAAASARQRGGFFFGFNIGPVAAPFGFGFNNFGYHRYGYGYVSVAPPVYYAPAPVCSPPAVYYSPAPVYVAPPVYCAPPVYYTAPRTYYYYGSPYHREYAPSYYYYRR